MADQADVSVKNWKYDSIVCKHKRPDGTEDSYTITLGADKEITLMNSNEELLVFAPNGLDASNFPVSVRSAAALEVFYSIAAKTWTIKTRDDTVPPEVPTTVNVNVGVGEPG